MLLPIQKLDEHGLRLAFEALNRCLEKMTHTPYDAAPWALDGGATLERPVINGKPRDASAVLFPLGSSISGSWRLPPLWVSGKIGMAVLLTGTVGSTDAIGLEWAVSGVARGAVLPFATLAAFTTPGPAAAAGLLKAPTPSLSLIDASAEKAFWTLARSSADAYAARGDVYIIGIEPLWYAGRQ